MEILGAEATVQAQHPLRRLGSGALLPGWGLPHKESLTLPLRGIALQAGLAVRQTFLCTEGAGSFWWLLSPSKFFYSGLL